MTTRKALNDQLELHMSELIRQLNEAIDEVKRRTGKAVLIVVEQTDKIDRAAATAIFRDHATTLAGPSASMIYTFPNAMRFSDDFNTIFLAFDNSFIFANLPVYRRADGGPNEGGRRKLAQLVYRRLEPALIDEDALTRLIENSGGQLTSLIFLVGAAALAASMRGQPPERITLADTDYAVNQLRRILIGALSEADYTALADFHRRRPSLTNEPDVQRLLYNGALLEYPGDDSAQNYPWCDAHPILWDRLTGE